jgi:NitT/TauT family transport system substrate-binding protein
MKMSHACATIGVLLCAALIAGCIHSNPSYGDPYAHGVSCRGPGYRHVHQGNRAYAYPSRNRPVDGYIAWQPFVEVPPMAGIGKVLVYSGDMPPEGKWKDHPCCVFTAPRKPSQNTLIS